MITSLFSSTIGDCPRSIVAGPFTLTASRDPLATDDTNAGWSVGSIWFNVAPGCLRWWECRQNTAGAAAWVFNGADYANGGTNPSSEITQFGSGTGTFGEEGNLYKYASAGLSPGGTGADYVVAVYALPANSLDAAGRSITINGNGGFANNTDTKRVKIVVGATSAVVGSAIVGGTVIADTGNYAVAAAVGWDISASITKYGAAGSNTQVGIHAASQMGAVVASLLPQSVLTLTESASNLIAITANATTTAADITLAWATINGCN